MSGWSGLVGREDARRVLGAVLREEDAEHGRVVAGDDREVLVVERLAHHHGDGLAGLELELANLAVLAPEEEPLVGAEDLRRADGSAARGNQCRHQDRDLAARRHRKRPRRCR